MAVTESYKAILKVQRWRDTPILSAADASALSNDMRLVAGVLEGQAGEIDRLRAETIGLQSCNKCNDLLPVTAFEFRADSGRRRPTCIKCRHKLSKRTKERASRPVPPERWPAAVCMASIPVVGDRRSLVVSL